MMETFENLMRLHLEYLEKQLTFEERFKTTKTLVSVIRQRIETTRTKTSEKIEQCQATINDQSRPAVVRRLAEQELETLQNVSFSASPEEREAFEKAHEGEKQAYEELKRAKTVVNEAFAMTRRKLEEMQKQSGYNQYFSSFPYWVNGNEKDFEILCREAK